MKRIVITGGAGFVGVNLVEYLLKNHEYYITIIDNLSGGNYGLLRQVVENCGGEIKDNGAPGPGRVAFLNHDVSQRAGLHEVLSGQEAIIHLAAQTGVIPSIQDPDRDAQTNVIGTLSLLQAAVDCQVKRFIFASSAAPLGEQVPPLDETKVPRPLSPYGASKLAGEAYCSAFHASFGLQTVALRFSNLYGLNSFHKGSVVAAFIKQILNKKKLVIYGDGEATRDYLYAGDLCELFHQVLTTGKKKIWGQTVQLGTGVETSVNQLIRLLRKTVGKSIPVSRAPARPGEILRNYTAIGRAREWLDFSPATDLSSGLRKTWQWFQEYWPQLKSE